MNVLDEKQQRWLSDVTRGISLLQKVEIRRRACIGEPHASLEHQKVLMFEFLMSQTTQHRVGRQPDHVIRAIREGKIKL